jgi:chemotaxis protein MotA
MDIATLIGIITAAGAILWAMYEGSHGHLISFFSTEGFVLVLGGSFAAVCLSMPLKAVLEVFGYIKTWLLGKSHPPQAIIQEIVHYAEIARREGVLALENEITKQDDPFLRKGLQLCVDSMDTAMIETTMRIEIEALAERHKSGKKFFELMGKYGPGFGLIATLIGQVGMFRNLGGDSSAIGQALAMALLGTLYGCIVCNVICGPIADKLAIRSAHEQFVREMMLVGILGLQAGDNPRMVQIKMQSFLSNREQRSLAAAAGAKEGS